jgi:hypothetical protein
MSEELNPLDMSDDEYMEMDWDTETGESEDDTADEKEKEIAEDSTDEAQADDADDSEDGEDATDTKVDSEDDAEESDTDSADKEDGEADKDEEEDPDESKIDYKTEYERLLAPFKAAGKNMQVDSVDDALQLMKMGAQFNKKMAGMKPSLKILKMLEKNDLLDEGKLSYLIDIDKKDPGAIKKLITDSETDTYDLENSEAPDYTPNDYKVDDKELALDEVIGKIQDTPTYNKTINVVGEVWDAASRNEVVANPKILEAINDQMQNGIYDQIVEVLDKEKALGRLGGLNDLEAYGQIGDRLYAEGKFNVKSTEPLKPTPKRVKPDPKIAQRKRAAAPTKAIPSQSQDTDFNPLSLSDEEFSKISLDKFL